MTLHSGNTFYFDGPFTFDIKDIAHSLALTCRFGGHCNEFYSVAEHSVRVSQKVGREHALWGLLHDAAEAYVGDIVKPRQPWCPQLKELESVILKSIAREYHLPWPIPGVIEMVDHRMCATEYRDLMNSDTIPSFLQGIEPFAEEIEPIIWREAEITFLDRFEDLGYLRLMSVIKGK